MKAEVRKMLRGADVGAEYWALAVRHLNEQWRKERIGNKEITPPFLSKMIVKKRYWKAKDFDVKNEVVRYIAPSWVFHGHWVLRGDGTKALTRAVITNTQEPITDEVWIAMEDAFTALDAREKKRRTCQKGKGSYMKRRQDWCMMIRRLHQLWRRASISCECN